MPADKAGVLVFCAEQGFAGAFSERVLDTVGAAPSGNLFLIGTRGQSVAAARGLVLLGVAGRGALPIVEALKETGAPLIPVPAPLLKPYVRLDPVARKVIPPYLFDFLRFPVVIGDRRFREAVGFEPEVGISEAVRACATRIPVG